MKRLTLVRHANAEPQGANSADFDRALTRRGQAEADALATHLFEQRLVPDLLLTSPAQRARQTAIILARQLELANDNLRTDPRLYLAQPEDILQTARSQASSVNHLMIVGHNPGISDLARLLAGKAWSGDLGTARACTMVLSTTAWPDVAPGQAIEVH